jgi:hypothetical protein
LRHSAPEEAGHQQSQGRNVDRDDARFLKDNRQKENNGEDPQAETNR